MQLSGHSYENQIFNSLLDGLKDDVVLKQSSNKKAEAPVSGMDVFRSTTQLTLESIREEELQSIANELQFAADRAKVAISVDDLAKFASEVKSRGFRGKDLERAARKYCNEVNRESAAPSGSTKLGAQSLIDQLATHRVNSATYHPDSVNDTNTGGYMGIRKNPNSIWDVEALQRLAQTKTGDEQIKESKEAREQFKLDQKKAFWESLQEKHSDTDQVHNTIKNAGTSATEEVAGQNLPANSMSIFNDDHDFSNLPEKTAGEMLKKSKEDVEAHKVEAKSQWNKSEPAQKTRSDIDFIFDGFVNKEQ